MPLVRVFVGLFLVVGMVAATGCADDVSRRDQSPAAVNSETAGSETSISQSPSSQSPNSSAPTPAVDVPVDGPADPAAAFNVTADGLQTATFGSGCFWCGEAVFEQLDGVASAVSGFSGGHVENPTYYQVVDGTSGHAEVFQVRYDPAVISYVDLLQVFWKTHDPTTLNRQGVDEGPQYRSVVFYHDDQQRQLAEELMKKLDASGAWNDPIVTEISAFTKFYAADKSHQDFYEKNRGNRYCRFTIVPKLEKLKKVFSDKLKEQE